MRVLLTLLLKNLKNTYEELAIYQLVSGEYKIIRGDLVFIDVPDNVNASLHTHPWDLPIPSIEDLISVLKNKEKVFGILSTVNNKGILASYSFKKKIDVDDFYYLYGLIESIAKESFRDADEKIDVGDYVIGKHTQERNILRLTFKYLDEFSEFFRVVIEAFNIKS